MKVLKFYDACCDNCGNWYGTKHRPPQTGNKKDAIQQMKLNDWKYKNGKTLCENCN